MKNVLLTVLLLFSLSGCVLLNQGIGDFHTAMNGLGRPSSQAPAPEPVQPQPAVPAPEPEPAPSPYMGMGPSLQFSLFYETYFFLGGYGFGDDNFQEGHGITWTIRSSGDSDEIQVTRALLKVLGDGSRWWLLSIKADGEEQFFELLEDRNNMVLKFRYTDPDTGRPGEYVPQPGEAYGQGGQVMTPDAWQDYVKNEENVRTGAGSFKAQHVVFEGKDPTNNQVQYRYEFWLSDRVAGRCVKYRYSTGDGKDFFSGEVSDMRGGYRTRLSSY